MQMCIRAARCSGLHRESAKSPLPRILSWEVVAGGGQGTSMMGSWSLFAPSSFIIAEFFL